MLQVSQPHDSHPECSRSMTTVNPVIANPQQKSRCAFSQPSQIIQLISCQPFTCQSFAWHSNMRCQPFSWPNMLANLRMARMAWRDSKPSNAHITFSWNSIPPSGPLCRWFLLAVMLRPCKLPSSSGKMDPAHHRCFIWVGEQSYSETWSLCRAFGTITGSAKTLLTSGAFPFLLAKLLVWGSPQSKYWVLSL